MFDKFGNKTEMRSAFLYVKEKLDFFKKSNLEEDIINMLKFGKNLSGEKAEFRVMIDIFFKGNPKEILKKIDYELEY